MRKRQDLTGQKFGRLTVIGTELDAKGKSLQVCLCECGNTVKLHTYRIKNGSTVSCGCHSRDKARERMSKEGADLARRHQLSKPLPVHYGDVFGMLTVIAKDPQLVPEKSTQRNRLAILCQCECGKEVSIWVKHLMSGHTVSCGCLKASGPKRSHGQSANRAHGIRGTGEYNSWLGMIDRCYNPIIESYLKYGLMGIIVCERWRNSFSMFFADMGPKPSKEHSLDRFPNPKGNYEPGNCRWATKAEQAQNRTYWTYEEKTEMLRRSSIHLAKMYMMRSNVSEAQNNSALLDIEKVLLSA